MRFNALKWLPLLFVSISAALGGGNDKPRFEVKPVSEYAHHETSEKVTIAAEPYETDEEAQQAFGKVNPYRYGILPVLIVVQNDGPDAIRVDRMKLVYVLPDRSRVEATPAADLKYLRGVKQPTTIPGPAGGPKITRTPKNPLSEWEIEGRAFAAKLIPPGQSASGFVYFQTHSSQAASIYISGLQSAPTGRELYYFEIPLSGSSR